MKFKELLEVLHPYSNINVETDESISDFETSICGLLKGGHQTFYNAHKDWNVVHSYPYHDEYGETVMVIKITDKPKHTCYFNELQHDNSRLYCLKCGDSIPKL